MNFLSPIRSDIFWRDPNLKKICIKYYFPYYDVNILNIFFKKNETNQQKKYNSVLISSDLYRNRCFKTYSRYKILYKKTNQNFSSSLFFFSSLHQSYIFCIVSHVRNDLVNIYQWCSHLLKVWKLCIKNKLISL